MPDANKTEQALKIKKRHFLQVSQLNVSLSLIKGASLYHMHFKYSHDQNLKIPINFLHFRTQFM